MYERVIKSLSEIGIPQIPRPDANNQWKTREDLYNTLKAIELLILKRKQIDADIQEKMEKRIEPLSASTKASQARLEEVQNKSKSISQEIEKCKQNLEQIKNKRLEQKEEQEKELASMDNRIKELNEKNAQKMKNAKVK